MKVENNKMVAVNYKLTVNGEVADQSQPGSPLQFICGTGMLLPKFEEAIIGKEVGDKVEFTLEPQDGYGEMNPEAVVELPKNIFEVEGEIPEDLLVIGNRIPMADASGNRLVGVVTAVSDEGVTMDFNHPMAGATLNFEVEVAMVRDVEPEDLAQSGGCGCESCGSGDCGEGCESEGSCGCGN
ncbi:MAG: peptidylprolyl isomerase [Rikenellaceae bacterium]